ncbi:uncharacterized protein [Diadema antillarum]
MTTELPSETKTEPNVGTTAGATQTSAATNEPTSLTNENATTAQTNPATAAPTEAPATEKQMTTKAKTQSPVVGTTAKTPAGSGGSKFSAGSFFGGIVLAVAVIGIAFCGFKFYQSRQDKNYQTL